MLVVIGGRRGSGGDESGYEKHSPTVSHKSNVMSRDFGSFTNQIGLSLESLLSPHCRIAPNDEEHPPR